MKKTILITGGGVNLGAAIALKFASHNWNVVINYNKSEKEANALATKINLEHSSNINVATIKADITKPADVKRLFENAIEQFGQIDVLLNNAGVYPAQKKIIEMDLQQWSSTLDLNVTSGLLTAKEFARQNIVGTKIINIASVGGRNIFKNRIDYNVSKSAMIRLTGVLASELAPAISVNCVCPGVIELENAGHTFGFNLPPARSIPMQRYAKVEDIFDAIYFFANCSHYITGQVLFVTGGMEL